jgi:hypothetical protein
VQSSQVGKGQKCLFSYEKFGLNVDCVLRVSRGERKSYKGWKIKRREKLDNKQVIV